MDLLVDFVRNGIDFVVQDRWQKVALEMCFPCDSYVKYVYVCMMCHG